jgi:hypothetical protein
MSPMWMAWMLAACGTEDVPEASRVFRLAYSHSVHGDIEPCG